MIRFALALIMILQAMLVPAWAETVPFDSDRWTIDAREQRLEEHLGQPSLYMKGGQARLDGESFVNGVVEFDIAFTGERGFMGGTLADSRPRQPRRVLHPPASVRDAGR